jgi:hypothetical protein
MYTARFANTDFFGPLQGLLRWWSGSRVTPIRRQLPTHEVSDFAPKKIAANDDSTRATGQNNIVRLPLRVVRVVESGQTRASVGRMVISGRMADVCAELDRLAAREAALS